MQDAFSCSPKARTDARIIANNERLLAPVSSAERGRLTAAAVKAGEDIVDVVGFIGVLFEECIEARDRGS